MKYYLAILFGLIMHASAGEIKNVLFIISDDLKTSVLGCYGDDVVRTPNIDKLAEQGMVFEKAYCQAVWCAPSRASFMSGRYKNPKKSVGMGKHFRANDVFSARVGKVYHMRVPGDIVAGTDGADHPEDWDFKFNTKGLEAHTPGLYAQLNSDIETTEMENRQSTGTKHRMFVSVTSEGDGSDQPDYQAADETIKLLNEHKDKPFFIAMGLVRPHYPMVAPKKYFDNYPLDKIKLPKVLEGDLDDIPKEGRSGNHGDKNGISELPENQKKMWAAYYASVEFMDDQIGRVMDELDKLGLRESTAVVFTSDHGYHLGEKNLWEKYNLHEEVSRVPLIISAPGMKTGSTNSLAELVDLYPTLTELAGIAKPKNVDGLSLVPVLKNPQRELRHAAYSYHSNGHALRTQHWAYMKFPSGEVLYDMKKDPEQFYNLATDPAYPERLDEFRSMLEQKLHEIKN